MIWIGNAIATGSETGAFGRLGLFVMDAAGSLLALTSRELMHGGDTVSLVAGDERRRIGSRRSPFHPMAGTLGAASGLAGWFCPDVEVPESLGDLSTLRVLDVDEQLGKHVFVACEDEVGPTGIVVRTRWFADVSAVPGRPPRPYDGLVRIRVASGPGNRAPGLSGALVRTVDDELVGIVVGCCDSDLVVAPLVSILKSENLRVATSEEIRSHNRAIRQNVSTARFKHLDRGLIALVSAKLGVVADDINLPEVVMLEWIRSGWKASTSDPKSSAFEPFEKYFTNLHGRLENLQSSILNFAVTELPTYPDHEAATDALSIAMLEFFESHGDWEGSVQRSKPQAPRPHGSHDYVRA